VTEPEPPELEIHYKGIPAISAPLAAERYGVGIDTMRKTLSRLRASGAIEALPKKLDERTEIYPLDDLEAAMADRPGKGANLRQREVRPMAELENKHQLAYGAAMAWFNGRDWPDETKERAARELATELWIIRDRVGAERMADYLENGPAHVDAVEGLFSSLRAQGAMVTRIPISRAVNAIALELTRS
jgi:hypothetical protein